MKIHGGPTSHSKAELNLGAQFWTTRGFALLDVNHGGSSGFGRKYRERLDGNWGVVDVGDTVAAVKYLVAQGRVDGNRAAIRGGSAGGYTVLASLAFHDVFKAGANYYGVSDLEPLAQDTHKFESRYLDRLVAPLPQGRALYEARAPIRHLEGFDAPLITFQGAEDKVVPPSQSRAIVAALQQKGVPVAYIEFEGEQHGFRKADESGAFAGSRARFLWRGVRLHTGRSATAGTVGQRHIGISRLNLAIPVIGHALPATRGSQRANPIQIAVNAQTHVSALLTHPPDATALYVFAHGAGAGMTHSFMESLRCAARAAHRHPALSVSVPGARLETTRSSPALSRDGARGGCKGISTAPRLAAVRRRKIFRRKNDFPGSGGCSAGWRARSGFCGVSAASGEAAGHHSRGSSR